MARTVLLQKLQWLSRLAMSADEGADFVTAKAAHDSRRNFLKTMSAVGLSAMLPQTALTAIKTDARIAIVGGGLAGLSCAYRLKKRGVVSTIYEASGHMGGRCSTNRNAFGQYVEQGGEFIDTGHREIRKLAEELGLELEDLWHYYDLFGGEESYYFDGAPYTSEEIYNDFLAVRPQLVAEVKAAPFPTTWDNFTPRGHVLDHMTIPDWINAYVPGGMASRFAQLLSIAYITEYGGEMAQQSALNLIYLLGYSAKSEFQIVGESDERWHVVGGNDLIVKRLVDQVGAGRIRLKHELTRIVKQADSNYQLFFNTPEGEIRRTAEHVVLALPFSILRRSVDFSQAGFDTRKIFAIQNMPMGQNAKMHVEFHTRYWRAINSDGSSYSDTGYQLTWEPTISQAGTKGVLTHYTGGDAAVAMNSATPTKQVAEFLQQLEPVIPGGAANATGRKLLNYWPGYKWTRGSYGYYAPGNYTAFVGYEGVRQGNCHFCGEHTSVASQGYLNGAVETGVRCAKEIILAL